MSLVSRLIDLVADVVERPAAPVGEAEKNLAVAALLVHVARVDGSFAQSERERVATLLSQQFGLSDEGAGRLVERGDVFDRQVDDIAELIDRMGHGVSAEERRHLVHMAYEVAGADGRMAEFEDDLIWRMGQLLGFDDPMITAIRREALQASDAPA